MHNKYSRYIVQTNNTKDKTTESKTLEKIIEEYLKCTPIKEIMRKYGINLTLLYKILKQNNIPLRKTEKRKMPKNKKKKRTIIKKIINMYKEGKSIYYISKKLGIPTSTIYYILKRHGYK